MMNKYPTLKTSQRKLTSGKLVMVFILIGCEISAWSQPKPALHYLVSVPQPASHKYHVELRKSGWNQDTLVFKIPKWMPGYYQIMDYAKSVESISVTDEKGMEFPFSKISDNTLRISGIRNKTY